MRLTSLSKGSSSTRGVAACAAEASNPHAPAQASSAVSVGSPASTVSPRSFWAGAASLHSPMAFISGAEGAWAAASLIAKGSHRAVTVMRFMVSVPVLSEQITVALPRASTAGRRRMMAFCAIICCTPMASTMVTIASSPSGMAATARLMAVMNISPASFP